MSLHDLFCHLVPSGKVAYGREVKSLNFFAKCGFGCFIGCFTGFAFFEMSLIALVDFGGCVLEAVPYAFAELFGHRAYLAPFVVQILQTTEGCDDIFFLDELFGLCAK